MLEGAHLAKAAEGQHDCGYKQQHDPTTIACGERCGRVVFRQLLQELGPLVGEEGNVAGQRSCVCNLQESDWHTCIC